MHFLIMWWNSATTGQVSHKDGMFMVLLSCKRGTHANFMAAAMYDRRDATRYYCVCMSGGITQLTGCMKQHQIPCFLVSQDRLDVIWRLSKLPLGGHRANALS